MELSGKQKEILEFMINFQEEKGYPPSVREICSAVSLNSTSTVHGHLSRLEAKGYIRKDPSKPRAIEIVRRPEQPEGTIYTSRSRTQNANTRTMFASNSAQPNVRQGFSLNEQAIPFQNSRSGSPRSANSRSGMDVSAVPVIAKVKAGEPILTMDNIIDYFPLPAEATRNCDCFMMRVQGESMVNAGIFENDLALVRMQRTAANHDIVVALLGDNITIKTFYREKDFIRLQPENDYMDPILIKDCTILGKVIGLYRSY